MKLHFPWVSLGAALLICGGLIGCWGGSSTPSGSTTESPGTAATDSDTEEPEVLLEPFDPPPLEELDAKAEWIDQPVLDSLELLRERLAQEEPLVSVEEALKLKNETPEDNEKILSGLGRLPKDDSEVDWDATINRHTRADLKSTNPIMISSTIEFDVTGLIGFGLMGFDWNFRPFAAKDTVVSWQTSKDRMYDKFIIRDDLTWSDGKPITAHDVVFSFQTIMNPKVPVPAVRSGTDKLRWVHAYDDHTLVIFHKEPLATNVWNISFPVLPKHIYEKSIEEDPTLQDSQYHVKYENNPISGGPYELTKRVRGQEIVLTRRESWYMHNGKQVRDKPYFKEVRFRVIEDQNTALLALKKGEIDEMGLSAEQWTTQTSGNDFYEHNTRVHGPEWTYFYFGWNTKLPFFEDARVRKAMSYAYNHKEMLEKLGYGLYEPATGVFHPDSWMAPKDPPKPYQQDLDKAEDLLEEAGWTDSDGDGIRDKEINGQTVRFEFSILCPNMPDRVAYCTLLKENLAQIGIICNVRPLEFTVMQEKTLKREFQAYFGGWGAGADPDTSDNLWVTGAGRNFVQYSNPEVDRLFVQGRQEFDREKRAEIYAKIHNILWEDQPYTWLYYRRGFYGFSKDLRGYVFSPRGPFNYGPGFGSFWKPKKN